jgi:ferredoxin
VLADLDPLVAALRAGGRRVVGPTVRAGAIVLAELESARELPYGWGVELTPGGYRMVRRDDGAAFAHAGGPESWKRWLHPPCVPLWTASRDLRVTEPEPDEPRYALLGVRPCDLRAIEILDRVLCGGAYPDERFARRRRDTFVVAVDCTEPGETCFCVDAGGGPGVGGEAAGGPGTGGRFDVALTELAGGDGVRYVATAGSAAGRALLAGLPHEEAAERDLAAARAAVDGARDRMGRSLPAVDLRQLLADGTDSPVWDDLARRCLACGNCTMACPTCFCTSVLDGTDAAGEVAARRQCGDSCFDTDFSFIHGGPVRGSVRARYRQWLTHKMGTWHDQFGESGCVGCGRCIVWCPVGIDLTAELHAIAAAGAAP